MIRAALRLRVLYYRDEVKESGYGMFRAHDIVPDFIPAYYARWE